MIEIFFDHFLIRITYDQKKQNVQHAYIAFDLKQDRKEGVKFKMKKRYNEHEFLVDSMFIKAKQYSVCFQGEILALKYLL